MNNKNQGQDFMANAEDVHKLPDEQAGSHQKNYQLSMTALNKVLMMDLLRLLRQAGRLCSDDAICYYDCIIHWVVIVAERDLECPTSLSSPHLKHFKAPGTLLLPLFEISSSKYVYFCTT
jgi:hypothetical protein